jgi:hypothetical protein
MKVKTKVRAGELSNALTLKEDRVTSKYLGRGVLIFAFSVVLAMGAEAQTSQTGDLNFTGYKVAIGVGVAVVAIVTVVVIYHSKKRTITGCVSSNENGMSVTDDRDKKSYALAGNTAGIKPGDRMTLQGKKIKAKDAGKMLVWEAKKINKDFGVCQPSVKLGGI